MNYKIEVAKRNMDYSPIQQVLINRGIKPSLIEKFLKTTDEDILDPMLLDNIQEAAVVLLKTIAQNKKAFIQVDSDCDGYTSSATLINYLYRIFPEWIMSNLVIRIHSGKEHGVIVETVPDDVSLVIIPDAGSNQYDEHKALKDRGMSIIILDHHEAEKVSEDAIVVNNQLCSYPTKSLSGVGIVYKFCQLLDKILKVDYADKHLDLVSLGMIADMMDVRDIETQHLIQKGLNDIQTIFMRAIIEKQAYSLGDIITPIGVAFYIAPFVNAVVRMGTQPEKEILFKSMLNHLALSKVPSTKRGEKGKEETVISQALRVMTNTKGRQKKSRDSGAEVITEIIERLDLNKYPVLVVPVEYGLDETLTGLVANQLAADYQKPVMLLRVGDTHLRGSARGYSKSNITDFRQFLLSSGLMEFAEGHDNAFGVGISKDNIPALYEYCETALSNVPSEFVYYVDFAYNYMDNYYQDLIDIGSMKRLWGRELDEANVAIEGIKISKSNCTLMSPDKKPALKITLPNGVSLIKFGSSHEEYNDLITGATKIIDVVGTVNLNEWGGNTTPQIFIKDYKIITTIKWDF